MVPWQTPRKPSSLGIETKNPNAKNHNSLGLLVFRVMSNFGSLAQLDRATDF